MQSYINAASMAKVMDTAFFCVIEKCCNVVYVSKEFAIHPRFFEGILVNIEKQKTFIEKQ